MNSVQRLTLGPDSSPLAEARSRHGRLRWAYQRAAAPESGIAGRAALAVVYDSDRLAFALADGPDAVLLAEQISDFLWMRETLGTEWPLNLREWLSDRSHWEGQGIGDPGGSTGFICGRLERNLPGGRIYLAWLGLGGVRLIDRAGNDLTLDTAIGQGEGWTRTGGPQPEGLALHAYRGGLFGVERLLVVSLGAEPLCWDLPDLGQAELQQALQDWAAASERDLALLDLRLTPVLTDPSRVTLNYRWTSPEECVLFWQPVPNVTAYRLEESSSADFANPALVAELTDGRQVQYRVAPPTVGPVYYRVVPLNQGLAGVPSEPVRPTPVVLVAPILQPVEWARDGGYVLYWTPIQQATGYEVQASEGPDFEPNESEIIYRGEIAEFYLPPSTPPQRYYRVRAINVLYAPQHPSPWSQPRRAPQRLETPHFTRVAHDRLVWDPVPGAQQYAVHVSVHGQELEQGEEVLTRETAVRVTGPGATYRVRALRGPDDTRAASDWSEPVTLAPVAPDPRARLRGPLVTTAVIGVALLGLLVGAALGIGAIETYQRARATATATPYAESDLARTRQAATAIAVNATAVDRLSTQVRQTEVAIVGATRAAAAWTATPTPTLTRTATQTPNATTTFEAAFAARLTATAAAWTATPTLTRTPLPTDTPTPTVTLTPSHTPDLAGTAAALMVAQLTGTAAAWTATPTLTRTPLPTDTPTPTVTLTPSHTPDLAGTAAALMVAQLTGTAAAWTATPTLTRTPLPTDTLTPTVTQTPSHTPDITGTVEALVLERIAQTAAAWTPVPEMPVPDPQATVAAYLAGGCFIVDLPAEALPVRFAPRANSRVVADAVPRLIDVTRRWVPGGEEAEVWLRVAFAQGGQTVSGWVRLPPGVDERTVLDGRACGLGE